MYLTHVICTIIDVFSAIFTSKSSHAIAGVVGIVVNALAAIHAGVKLSRTKLNFCLAKLAKEAPRKYLTINILLIDQTSEFKATLDRRNCNFQFHQYRLHY
jgi:hypothetical protein